MTKTFFRKYVSGAEYINQPEPKAAEPIPHPIYITSIKDVSKEDFE
jgi:hypothetical protein